MARKKSAKKAGSVVSPKQQTLNSFKAKAAQNAVQTVKSPPKNDAAATPPADKKRRKKKKSKGGQVGPDTSSLETSSPTANTINSETKQGKKRRRSKKRKASIGTEDSSQAEKTIVVAQNAAEIVQGKRKKRNKKRKLSQGENQKDEKVVLKTPPKSGKKGKLPQIENDVDDIEDDESESSEVEVVTKKGLKKFEGTSVLTEGDSDDENAAEASDEDQDESVDEEQDNVEESEEEEPKQSKKSKQPTLNKKAEQAKKTRYIVFAGNLPYDAKKEEIIEHFKTAGQVRDIRIPLDKTSNKPRGFAYIEFDDEMSYQKGLSMHHTSLKGRRINCFYTQGGKKKGEARKKEVKAKNFKLQEMRKQGQLAGSVKQTQKRSFRRNKNKKVNGSD